MPAKCFNTPIENALCRCQFRGKLGKIGDTLIGYWPQRKGSFAWGSRCLCQISSKSVKNCDRESADRQTDTHTDRQRWQGWSVPCYAIAMGQIIIIIIIIILKGTTTGSTIKYTKYSIQVAQHNVGLHGKLSATIVTLGCKLNNVLKISEKMQGKWSPLNNVEDDSLIDYLWIWLYDTQGGTGVEKTGSSGFEYYSCEVIYLRRNIAGI